MDNKKIFEVMGIGGKITDKHITLKMKISSDDIITDADFSSSDEKFILDLINVTKSKLANNSIDFALCINSGNLVENYEVLSDINKQDVYMIEEAIKNAIGDYYTKVGVFEKEENNCQCCKCE